MERIWAPWREVYFNTLPGKKCIFCIGKDSRRDSEKYVVKRNKYCFLMLNKYPYNNGHMMIAPYRHIKHLRSLSSVEILDILKMLKETCSLLTNLLRAEGFNIGVNLGKVAGAGYEAHLHIHIVPRWVGDTNFMPVIGQTKVISESLNLFYERIKDAYQRGNGNLGK